MRNLVNDPTRLNAVLDLIFVDERMYCAYDSVKVEIGPPIGSSDHNSVFVPPVNYSRKQAVKRYSLYDLRESNILAFEKQFLSCDFERFYSDNDVDNKCSIFYEHMYKAMSVIPCTEVILTDNDTPWMSPLIKFLIDQRWKAFRARDWQQYNSLKMKVKQEITKAKMSFFKKRSTSVKGLWSYVNFERGCHRNDFTHTSTCSDSYRDAANSLNDYFCSIMNSTSVATVPEAVSDDG